MAPGPVSTRSKVGAYIALTKPRIIELLLITTVPTMIVRLIGRPGATNFGQAMAMATILMVLTMVAVAAIERARVGDRGDF